MSRRRKHRGERRPALFGFDAGAPTDMPEEVPDNPLARPCGWCGAQPGERCTVRLGHGRRVPLTEHDPYHPARKSPQETP